ncbi:MAG: ATP synthase F1 subunit epsilon [Chloroflexota bacterium]|nr:ATP synthase F1 subunit epsilon [Chloroflexota bacterium]
MDDQERQLHVSLVTPDNHVYNDAAEGVVLPGAEGQLAILIDHTPLLTALGAGDLVVKRKGLADKRFVTRGGFAEVSDNEVTILVDAAREV